MQSALVDQDIVHFPAVSMPAEQASTATILSGLQDLLQHARGLDLTLADEMLTEVLARLNGWPVDELDRLG